MNTIPLRIFPDGHAVAAIELFLDQSYNINMKPYFHYCHVPPPQVVNLRLREEKLEIASYEKLAEFRKLLNPIDVNEREGGFVLTRGGERVTELSGVFALDQSGSRFAWVNRRGEEGVVNEVGFCRDLFRTFAALTHKNMMGAYGVLVSPARG